MAMVFDASGIARWGGFGADELYQCPSMLQQESLRAALLGAKTAQAYRHANAERCAQRLRQARVEVLGQGLHSLR